VSSPPLVSCLLTAYNHERFVVEAVESALVQLRDFPPGCIELLLVDDGSTDGTPERLAPYADRIRIIRKPNGGLLSTATRALEEARGELFCYLSCDDVWAPGKLARQARILAQRPWVSLVYSDARIINDRSETIAPSYYERHGLPRPVGDARGSLLEKNPICAPAVMMRTSLRDRVLPIRPPAVWEDWWMFHHAARAGELAHLCESDVGYRTHDSNVSQGHDEQARRRFIAQELPFRRWLLLGDDLAGVPLHDLVDAWRALDWHLSVSVEAGLGTAPDLLGLSDSAQAEGAELLAEARALDPLRGLRALIRALAADPTGEEQRVVLPAMLAAAERALPPLRARRTLVRALASEVAWQPVLLEQYARAVSGRDDVSLVVDARGWSADRIADELVTIAAEAGLADDDGPDVLIVDDGRPVPAPRVAGVLTFDCGTAVALGGRQLADAEDLRSALRIAPRVTGAQCDCGPQAAAARRR